MVWVCLHMPPPHKRDPTGCHHPVSAKLMQFRKKVKLHSFTFLCVSQCPNLHRGINVSFLSQNTDLLYTEMDLNNPNLINFSA